MSEEAAGLKWSDDREAELFTDQRCRTEGVYNGFTRRVEIVNTNEDKASPGHILLPAVTMHVGKMSCAGFLGLIGEFLL